MVSLQTATFYRQPFPLQRTIYSSVMRRSYLRERELRRDEINGYSLEMFDAHRCIFIHIPKAAGVSVSRSLFDSLGGGHRSAGKYRLIFGPETYDDYFKFAFVRNPWDRVVSAFLFLKGGGLNSADRAFSQEHLSGFHSFGDFARNWLRPDNLHNEVHFIPQNEFLCLSPGQISVDFVGRFETLHDDFAEIARRLGVERTLRHENRTATRRPDYHEYYDAQTRAIVASAYAEDIDMFGYEF